ncbi:MAG: lysozyme [Hymenobacteraceae bacterium]|nr:lysozyme [Hymenobacteraceae bacterium]MDX5510864.1 lysozyme [Hymenobacteraceae bacterium]
MESSKKGIDLIKSFECLELKAYKCPAGIWTIGYGATFYQNGSKIKPGDKISEKEADELLKYHIASFDLDVRKLLKTRVSQVQFDALVSFAFNCGSAALGKSTLLKKVNANPNDPAIKHEFMKWIRSGGKVLNGLIRRRTAEVALYFSQN